MFVRWNQTEGSNVRTLWWRIVTGLWHSDWQRWSSACQWPKGQGSCDLAGILPASLLWPCVALGACCSFQKPQSQSCTAQSGSGDWSSAREGRSPKHPTQSPLCLHHSLPPFQLFFHCYIWLGFWPIVSPWPLPCVRIKLVCATLENSPIVWELLLTRNIVFNPQRGLNQKKNNSELILFFHRRPGTFWEFSWNLSWGDSNFLLNRKLGGS